MNRAQLRLLALLAGLLLAPTAPAAAQSFAPMRSVTPANRPWRPVNPNRMPGWDWWRTYPWSPYNQGRNPYNPYVVDPYAQPYPYYPGGGAPGYGPYDDAAPHGAMFPSALGQNIQIPHPSGELRTPPPGAAIVLVRVPDASARVLFDGERTYTVGTRRYFVTPELPESKTMTYTVTASWRENGQEVNREQPVKVTAGHTTVVDFRTPVGE
jgi:uncharacterized protein (TIGR03000 family)